MITGRSALLLAVGLVAVVLLTPLFQMRRTIPHPGPLSGELGSSVVHLNHDGSAITVERADEAQRMAAPSGQFFSGLVVAPDADCAYLILNRGGLGGGAGPESVVRVQLPPADAPLESCRLETVLTRERLGNVLPEAWVSELDAVSEDGERLLLRVRYKDEGRSTEGSTRYVGRPFFYDIATDELHPVVP